MEPALQRILVVGGNGFIGSAVCKAALARGYKVTSISSSGKPYKTAKGHTPAWVSNVDWQKADAFEPATYVHIMPTVNGVVHTMGTLLEGGGYKSTIKEGNLGALLRSYLSSGGGNPLEKDTRRDSYEAINRDAALRVCETFLGATPIPEMNMSTPRAFVYMSAEDLFRPIIPFRYIDTKRQAEQGIENMMRGQPGYRAVYMRPSLVYHAHHRPLTSPAAALIDLSAVLHSKVPPRIPTPSSTIRAIGSAFGRSESLLNSIANALTIPPVHLDHVAEAICIAIDPTRHDVTGVVDVKRMRKLMGWTEDETSSAVHQE